MKRTDHLLGVLGYLFAAGAIALAVMAWPVGAQTPGHDPSRWHPPISGGPYGGHEHGDQCPDEVLSVTEDPRYRQYFTTAFDWAGNTSPLENAVVMPDGKYGKHFAHKIYSFRSPAETGDPQYGFTDQQGGPVWGCVIGHISGTPGDRGVPKHGFRVYVVDDQHNLTVRQGWASTTGPDQPVDGNRIPKDCQSSVARAAYCDAAGYGSTDQRPIVLTIDEPTALGTYTGRPDPHEQWYFVLPGAFNIAWGLNAPALYHQHEGASTDPATWTPSPDTRAHGQVRFIELVARAPVGIPAGGVGWWACPDGQAAFDQSVPECPGGYHPLLQWVAGTYKGIKGRDQQQWPVPLDVGLQN